MLQWGRLVRAAVEQGLCAERLPVLLGSDHSLAIGSISVGGRRCGETDRKLWVLWLNAHADFDTGRLSPSRTLHGRPVACLCGSGPKALVEFGGATPGIHPQWLRQSGVRSAEEGEKWFCTGSRSE